jgi:hypothetical protein
MESRRGAASREAVGEREKSVDGELTTENSEKAQRTPRKASHR